MSGVCVEQNGRNICVQKVSFFCLEFSRVRISDVDNAKELKRLRQPRTRRKIALFVLWVSVKLDCFQDSVVKKNNCV